MNGSDAMLRALGPAFGVLVSDGGCLGGHAGGPYHADARALAVALVKPPAPVPAWPHTSASSDGPHLTSL